MFLCSHIHGPNHLGRFVVNRSVNKLDGIKDYTTKMKRFTYLSKREETVLLLTSRYKKVWKVTSARLTNIYGTLDMSTGNKIRSTEFMFFRSANPQTNGYGDLYVEYRPGYSINTSARTLADCFSDTYLDPIESELFFEDVDETLLTAFEGQCRLLLNHEQSISLAWAFGEQAVLEMTLQPKTSEDYLQLPSGSLNFKEAFALESAGVEGYSPDLIGSELEQCLFFATQEDWGEEGKQKYGLDGVLLERVSRIDLTSGEITDIFSPGNFYATKRMVLHDNRLLVVGACKINSYDLSLQSAPKSSKDYCAYVNHTFSGVSRFGAAASNGKVYLVGGSVHNDMSGVGEDKIYQYDPIMDNLDVFGELPGPIRGAAAEIVHGKLYIFGVSTTTDKSPLGTSLTIYDLDGRSCTTEQLPVALQQVHVSRKEHLIFMAGVMVSNAQNESASQSQAFVGVYDTRHGTFRTLETNLRNNADNTIHAMTVVRDDMYLLCGKRTVDHYQLQPWRILKGKLHG